MLALSSKYAIRALLVLTKSNSSEFVSVDVLAEKANVPRPYLAKLIKALAAREIVITKKGLTGGVKLNTERGSISFYDVCDALDDPIVRESCFLSQAKCNSTSPCQFHGNWGRIRADIAQCLEKSKVL